MNNVSHESRENMEKNLKWATKPTTRSENTRKLNYKYILDLIFNEMQRMTCDYSISLFQDAS